jgi:ComF family protein
MAGWDWLRRFWGHAEDGLISLLYPPICPICDQALAEHTGLFCPPCLAELAGGSPNACPRCAGIVGPYQDLSRGCLACKKQRFHFEGAVRLGLYEGRLRDAVLRCKHHSGEILAELLGKVFALARRDRFDELGADALVPVPLHWRRKWWRGYNQSEAIARGLGSVLGLPVCTGWLKRVRNTPSQHLLPPSKRKGAMKGAFRARQVPALAGRTVLLVDDVMTTGGTSDEAAGALLEGGAGKVIPVVLARAS